MRWPNSSALSNKIVWVINKRYRKLQQKILTSCQTTCCMIIYSSVSLFITLKLLFQLIHTHQSIFKIITVHEKLTDQGQLLAHSDKSASIRPPQVKATQSTNSKIVVGAQNANMNVASSGKKMNSKKNVLPPKPVSKIQFNVEGNMTTSKIFIAKKGLELLKKKMNRTGMSRQKISSKSVKNEQALNIDPFLKKSMSAKVEQENTNFEGMQKRPSQYSRNEKTRESAKESPIQLKSTNKNDERPIANPKIDFMQLLERQLKNQKQQKKPLQKAVLQKDTKIYDQNGKQIVMELCSMGCGRMFNVEVISKHQKVCHKVFQSKRKAFDSASHRHIEGDPVKKIQTSKIMQEKPKKKNEVPKWKIESDLLRAGLKLGKNTPLSKQQQQSLQSQQNSLIPCHFCGRKFSEVASVNHLKFCENKSKQIAKNNVPKKR